MVFSACVCQPVCPTSNNFWVLSNFNISEHSPGKQVHSMIDSKESVQDTNLCFTGNWVLLIQLLMKPLVSSVTLNCFFSKLGRSVLYLNGFLTWLDPGWIALMGNCEMMVLVLIQVCKLGDLALFLCIIAIANFPVWCVLEVWTLVWCCDCIILWLFWF